jgi:hypothetical protein
MVVAAAYTAAFAAKAPALERAQLGREEGGGGLLTQIRIRTTHRTQEETMAAAVCVVAGKNQA